jgi:hypothetical protein
VTHDYLYRDSSLRVASSLFSFLPGPLTQVTVALAKVPSPSEGRPLQCGVFRVGYPRNESHVLIGEVIKWMRFGLVLGENITSVHCHDDLKTL